MTYTAKDLFPEWYAVVELQPSTDTLTARTKAIKKVITKEKKNGDFWLDLIRLFLGGKLKSTENRDAFVQEFKTADENFPLTNNDNLVRVLASSAICFKLETEDNRLNNIISLAIKNSIFFGQYEILNEIPVVQFADVFLSTNRYEDRRSILTKVENTVEGLAKPPAATEAAQAEDRDKLVNGVLLPVISAYRSVSEESNILWWIFREYSDLNQDYLSNVGHLNTVVSGAFELSNLTEFSRGLFSAEAILHKAIFISNNSKDDFKKTTIEEVVNKLPEAVKTKLQLPKELTELTPCLKAIEISLNHNPGDNWSGAFDKQTNGADSKKKFHPLELASQFYREFTFLRTL